MAFASGHLLAGVIAAHPRHLGRFHALTIEGSCRWLLVTTRSLAHLSPQGIVNALPRAIITKGAKIRVHALPGGILPREYPPLAASDREVQQCLDHRSHLQCAWLASWLCRWNQLFDTIPLRVGQIGWIHLSVFHPSSVPSPVSDCHPFSNRLLA